MAQEAAVSDIDRRLEQEQRDAGQLRDALLKARERIVELEGGVRTILEITTNEPDAVDAATRASYIAFDLLKS